jgi:hypothetical protein
LIISGPAFHCAARPPIQRFREAKTVGAICSP